MQIEDFFWSYFEKTGGIGAYLMYKILVEEQGFAVMTVNQNAKDGI